MGCIFNLKLIGNIIIKNLTLSYYMKFLSYLFTHTLS